MANSSPLAVSKRSDSYWRATFDNPPLNLIDPETIIALRELMDTLEADPAVKVVVFDSADEEYFIAHFDVARGGELPGPGPTGLPAWPDLATRLTCAPFVTIAEIRGRARGVGSEFALACDLRFASRGKAVFGQPEVGTGLVPGGGSIEVLSALAGRSRTLEIILGSEDFDADTAERYGWINRARPDAELPEFVDRLARRIASFEQPASSRPRHRSTDGQACPQARTWWKQERSSRSPAPGPARSGGCAKPSPTASSSAATTNSTWVPGSVPPTDLTPCLGFNDLGATAWRSRAHHCTADPQVIRRMLNPEFAVRVSELSTHRGPALARGAVLPEGQRGLAAPVRGLRPLAGPGKEHDGQPADR